MFYDFKNCIFNAFNAICRYQHSYIRFVFRTETFKFYVDFYFIARNDIDVDDCRCIVLSVFTVEQWFCYNGFTKVTFYIALSNTFIDSFFKVATNEMYVLTYFYEYQCHTSILAVWTIFSISNFCIFDDLIENDATNWRLFCFTAFFQTFIDVFWQVVSCVHTHLTDCFCDFRYLNLAQDNPSSGK